MAVSVRHAGGQKEAEVCDLAKCKGHRRMCTFLLRIKGLGSFISALYFIMNSIM